MKNRCQNPKADDWDRYGGRGIKVCDSWQHFENFLADMGERPKGKTIDRRDNNGSYCPENCRWATRKEQQRNQGWTFFVTLNGIKRSAREWGEILGMKFSTIKHRIRQGWTPEKALLTKVRKTNARPPGTALIEFGGRKMTASDWSKRLKIRVSTLKERLRAGWSVKRTLTTKTRRYATVTQ